MKYLIALILALTTFNVMAAKIEEERVCIEDQCYTVLMEDISRSHRAMYHQMGQQVFLRWNVVELGVIGMTGSTITRYSRPCATVSEWKRGHQGGPCYTTIPHSYLIGITGIPRCEYSTCRSLMALRKFGRGAYSSHVWDSGYTHPPTAFDIVQAAISHNNQIEEQKTRRMEQEERFKQRLFGY